MRKRLQSALRKQDQMHALIQSHGVTRWLWLPGFPSTVIGRLLITQYPKSATLKNAIDPVVKQIYAAQAWYQFHRASNEKQAV